MSSKKDFKGRGVLDTLLFTLESKDLAHKSRITYHESPRCQEWPQPPNFQSGTFNVFKVWLRGQGDLDTLQFMLESWNLEHKSSITYNDPIFQVSCQKPSMSYKYVLRGQGVLDTLLFMPESWDLAHKSSITYHGDPRCQEWLHPTSILSGTFNVLQVWLWGRGLLHTSIHARELKLCTQVKNHIAWQSMMPRMTPSSKSPVMHLQIPPSIISRMWVSWADIWHRSQESHIIMIHDAKFEMLLRMDRKPSGEGHVGLWYSSAQND